MSNVAFITGITGQDGSYLAELLLDKGYKVHGLLRRSSSFNTARVDGVFNKLHLHFGDLSDGSNLARLLHSIKPSEIYNLGAQSHVRVSFDCPEYTFDIGATGTLRLLEAVRSACPEARYYQASSSEMFGNAPSPQSEDTPFEPRSPYACAKVAAYWLTNHYREAYQIHASNGILFNHESPRRGRTFVTQKIVAGVVAHFHGRQDKLLLGNLDARRDWGHAKDYVRAMWLMLQAPISDDYVVATGHSTTVLHFLEMVCHHYALDWKSFVEIDPRLFRPTEVDFLQGNPAKIQRQLDWVPQYSLYGLVKDMIEAEEKNYQ